MKKFEVKKYFLLFMMYSIVGWVLEVLLALICHHKFINRGVLIGPYLPIYGIGCVLILLLVGRYKDKPILLVLYSMLICSVLEYVTSFLLEVAFNTRWWDYSGNLINLNGRICLETTLLFGILGSLIVYIVNPFFLKLVDRISERKRNFLFYMLIIVLIIDMATSFTSVALIRNTFDENTRDTTEEVSRKAIKFIKELFINIKKTIV